MGKGLQSVQVFGRKKTATAVAHCKRGKGLVKVNGRPLALVEPRTLRQKFEEPLLLLGKDRFSAVDIRIKVKGGGHVAQVYAIRQAISKSLVAYYQKYVDEAPKKEIKDILISYDRSLLVADPRRNEPKKFGGPGASALPEILSLRSFIPSFLGESKIASSLSSLRPLGTLKTQTLSLSLSSASCTRENICSIFVFLYNAVYHYHLYYVFLKEMKN